MPENKNQHYVPQWYLRNFSDNGKQIGVYNIPSSRFIRKGTIRQEASEDYFYGKDSQADEVLREIETEASEVIKNIIKNGALPIKDSTEFLSIFKFIGTLQARTKYRRASYNERIEEYYKLILNRKHDISNEDLDLIKITDKNASQHEVWTAIIGLPVIYDLKIKLVVNKTALSFWTSDNPTVFLNHFLEKRRPELTNTGWIMKGLQIFCPISPKQILFFYDENVYKAGNKNENIIDVNNVRDIEEINKIQLISATENIYFNDTFNEVYLRSFSEKFQAERVRGRFGYKAEIISEKRNEKSGEIIQRIINPEIRGNLNLSFVKLLRKAQKFIIKGKDILLPRSEEALSAANLVREISKGKG